MPDVAGAGAARRRGGGRQLQRRGGSPGRGGVRRPLGGGGPVAGRQDLRPRRAGHRHRGPPGEPDPLRARRTGAGAGTDRAGSLLAILQEFAARSVNLTKLESRPTKKALGDYCFIIDLEGHLADELVADCLRDVRSKVADIKFLGSYPAAGEHGPARRRDAEEAWRAADAWVAAQRAKLGS